MAKQDEVKPEVVPVESLDPRAEARELFMSAFPGVVQDGVVDAEGLAAALGLDVAGLAGGKERFGLQWAGKRETIASLQVPSAAALAPDMDESIDWDTAQNVFIEGDNLEVLKLLQKAYNDQVKLIYIDPPYNTGNDFVYHDDFADPVKRYLEVTGQIDAEGNRLTANTEVSGRKHSNWLNMMYPRLVLARNLLTEDGSIFISIDDNEVAHLRLLMDEVFGPENFIAEFIWAAGRKNDAKFVSVSHEYMLVYSRNSQMLKAQVGEWRTRKEGLDEIYAEYAKLRKKHGDDHAAISATLKSWFKHLAQSEPAKRHAQYTWSDARGIYFAGDISWPGGGGPRYEVCHPKTGKPVKIPATGWRISSESRMQELLRDDRVHFGADETSVPCLKRYLRESEGEVPYSVFYVDGRGATKRLRAFLGGAFFDFPKDELVLQKVIEFATDRDSIVMDFFAGSGTTGHAVALQNAQDGGSRKYVLVNIPEAVATGSAAAEAGLETVSEISLTRLQKVAESVPGANAMGLRALNLDTSSFVNAAPEADGQLKFSRGTLSKGLCVDAIAAEALLKHGVRLDLPWSRVTIPGGEIVLADDRAVVVTAKITSAAIDAALATAAHTVIFLEDSFAGHDDLKAKAYFALVEAKRVMATM